MAPRKQIIAQRFPSVAILGVSPHHAPPLLRALSNARSSSGNGLLRLPPSSRPSSSPATVQIHHRPLSLRPQRVHLAFPPGVTVRGNSTTLPPASLTSAFSRRRCRWCRHINTRFTLQARSGIIECCRRGRCQVLRTHRVRARQQSAAAAPCFPIFAPGAHGAEAPGTIFGLPEKGRLDYTLVFVGLFLDKTGLGGFLIDVKNKKQELWDGGEHPISLTSTASIAKAVVAILEGRAAGKTEVRIKDINLSQKRLLELCAKVVGPRRMGGGAPRIPRRRR